MTLLSGNCDEDLMDFFGIEPDKACWITYQEYMDAPIEELHKLNQEYKLFWCPEGDGTLYLIPRQEENVDNHN